MEKGHGIADGRSGGTDEARDDVEDRVARGHLPTRVPAGDEVGGAGEESRLEDTKKGTHTGKG